MQQTFAIESGVAIPERRWGKSSLFPFRSMKAGDSFLIRQNGDNKKRVENLRVLALLKAKQLNIQVTSRLVKGGIRVWRVK